jgi:protein SCO1
MRGRIVMPLLVCFVALACRQAPKLPVLHDGGDFALTDHNGQHFELSSLRGKAVLIFFGYTSCPDVCPTTLSKLSEVYLHLGDDSKRVKTLYITVDPGRDTPFPGRAE